MKKQFTWLGIVTTVIMGISIFFAACNKDDLNDVVVYEGQVVYINTTNPFADLTVKVTNGKDTHCQTQTDAGGLFSLKVRVNEIDGNYYLLAGDSTCIPKKVNLGGYGQAEVDLGVIEVEGPALPTVKTAPIQEENISADEAIIGGEVLTDGRLSVTARGVCYGTDPYPTVDGMHTTDGTGLGVFTSTLKNLEYNTIYYARAYAINKMGTAYDTLQVKFTTEEGVAVVVTDTIINITAHSAKCKGHVESDGGFPVVKRGTCWSKRPDPTVDDNCTDDGSGKGEFTSSMNNLVENTTYYVRTYATNSTKTTYGEQKIITTKDGLAVVTTDSIPSGSITATGFTAYGTVVSDCDIPVTARGFCYSTSQYPTVEDNIVTIGKGLGSYQGNIRNLQVGTTYYVRAYATNETATTYGEQLPVTTKDGLPVVETNEEATSTAFTINAGGKVVDNGGFSVTDRGICCSATNTEPTITDQFVSGGKGNGSFTVALQELTPATKYYLRAYATNENGTSYGNVINVISKDGNASVSLTNPTNITALTASASVTVTDASGATLQSCGICWSANPNPTITDNKTIASGRQLNTPYVCNMVDLQPNTTYYVRAYATTDVTTAYSEEKSFTTNTGLPVLTTSEASATSMQIISGGIITSDGGYSITARGVCYSTSNSMPTIEDGFTTSGMGIGTFSTIITEVNVSTTYYIRAYATNNIGTGYGKVVAVTTDDGLPSVTTTTITKSGSLFLSGGYIADDGGYTITERGICFGTYPHPDLSDTYNHTSDGTGIGYYTSQISITSGVVYVRAYATNINGTAYGEEISIDLSYLSLPSFSFNSKKYRVAPNAQNTMYISQAKTYCSGLELYGYSDWRLPDSDELYQMYLLRSSIGDFITSDAGNADDAPFCYWCLQYNINPYFIDFRNGEGLLYSSGRRSVRPIRVEE